MTEPGQFQRNSLYQAMLRRLQDEQTRTGESREDREKRPREEEAPPSGSKEPQDAPWKEQMETMSADKKSEIRDIGEFALDQRRLRRRISEQNTAALTTSWDEEEPWLVKEARRRRAELKGSKSAPVLPLPRRFREAEKDWLKKQAHKMEAEMMASTPMDVQEGEAYSDGLTQPAEPYIPLAWRRQSEFVRSDQQEGDQHPLHARGCSSDSEVILARGQQHQTSPGPQQEDTRSVHTEVTVEVGEQTHHDWDSDQPWLASYSREEEMMLRREEHEDWEAEEQAKWEVDRAKWGCLVSESGSDFADPADMSATQTLMAIRTEEISDTQQAEMADEEGQADISASQMVAEEAISDTQLAEMADEDAAYWAEMAMIDEHVSRERVPPSPEFPPGNFDSD